MTRKAIERVLLASELRAAMVCAVLAAAVAWLWMPFTPARLLVLTIIACVCGYLLALREKDRSTASSTLYTARPADLTEPVEHRLAELLAALSVKAGLETPKLVIINGERPSLSVTPLAETPAKVIVTKGTLALGASDMELAGALAHELGHLMQRRGHRLECLLYFLNAVLVFSTLMCILANFPWYVAWPLMLLAVPAVTHITGLALTYVLRCHERAADSISVLLSGNAGAAFLITRVTHWDKTHSENKKADGLIVLTSPGESVLAAIYRWAETRPLAARLLVTWDNMKRVHPSDCARSAAMLNLSRRMKGGPRAAEATGTTQDPPAGTEPRVRIKISDAPQTVPAGDDVQARVRISDTPPLPAAGIKLDAPDVEPQPTTGADRSRQVIRIKIT